MTGTDMSPQYSVGPLDGASEQQHALIAENNYLRTEVIQLYDRLRAAFTELATHGDLTPSGKRVLNQILDGGQ